MLRRTPVAQAYVRHQGLKELLLQHPRVPSWETERSHEAGKRQELPILRGTRAKVMPVVGLPLGSVPCRESLVPLLPLLGFFLGRWNSELG